MNNCLNRDAKGLNHDSKRLRDYPDFPNQKKSSHQANPKNQGSDNE